MSLSLNTLRLLQGLLGQQQISVSADDDQITAVLQAKRELAEAVKTAEAEA